MKGKQKIKNGRRKGRKDVWMDQWINQWIDGWMDGCVFLIVRRHAPYALWLEVPNISLVPPNNFQAFHKCCRAFVMLCIKFSCKTVILYLDSIQEVKQSSCTH